MSKSRRSGTRLRLSSPAASAASSRSRTRYAVWVAAMCVSSRSSGRLRTAARRARPPVAGAGAIRSNTSPPPPFRSSILTSNYLTGSYHDGCLDVKILWIEDSTDALEARPRRQVPGGDPRRATGRSRHRGRGHRRPHQRDQPADPQDARRDAGAVRPLEWGLEGALLAALAGEAAPPVGRRPRPNRRALEWRDDEPPGPAGEEGSRQAPAGSRRPPRCPRRADAEGPARPPGGDRHSGRAGGAARGGAQPAREGAAERPAAPGDAGAGIALPGSQPLVAKRRGRAGQPLFGRALGQLPARAPGESLYGPRVRRGGGQPPQDNQG